MCIRDSIETNQMPILGVCFLCNMVSGNMLNTGAFEIKYNGAPVWSKMETGRFPQMDELRDALNGVMQVAQQAIPQMAQAQAVPDSDFGHTDL